MTEWFLLYNGAYLYLILSLLLIGGAFGLPIPEDLPLILAGVAVNLGKARWDLIYLSAYLSIILGDLIIFGIGYRFGFTLFQLRFIRARISPERITEINARLEKHAISMIVIARHLFYLRTATFLACGAFRMSVARFILIDAIAALLSTSIMISAGYFAAEHLSALLEFMQKVKLISIPVGILIIFYLLYRIRRSEKKESMDRVQKKSLERALKENL
jgi:membrane protein DedA with SNARE-associated domain